MRRPRIVDADDVRHLAVEGGQRGASTGPSPHARNPSLALLGPRENVRLESAKWAKPDIDQIAVSNSDFMADALAKMIKAIPPDRPDRLSSHTNRNVRRRS